ncbi:hypothetical protein [Actinomyces faecalis]|uniref:hypothetical protein n=1 Tax=Actinomyces faecalis TaxID=2722820 RepID=UPI001552F299|nr:hypothetical protein [Actinomyces faecalis]
MEHDDNVINQYLLVYDRKRDLLVSQEDYGTDTVAATSAYRAAEQLYHDQPWMDIVLVGSDSIETVKKTHSTYFESFSLKNLRELVASFTV